MFRHASVTTAVVIGWYLKTGDSRFSRRIGCNVSRPGRNTDASDAWPSFKVFSRRRWIGAKSLVCTPGFKLGVHTRDCTCLRPDWTVASQSGRDSSASTVTTRSRPSDSLKTADVYAPWCHLVFRHASVTTAVVIGWYLKTGDSRFSGRIGCNVSRPGRNTVASDAWPSFKVFSRRRWIGAKSLVCTPGFKLGVHTRDCTCLRPDWTVASQSGRDSSASTVTTRSRPSDSLKTADVYAPWCHLVFRHASVTTAVVIGWYLKTGDSRFSGRIGCNVSRPGRNTVASDAWPSFKARRRWIGAKSLVCTPGFRRTSARSQTAVRLRSCFFF